MSFKEELSINFAELNNRTEEQVQIIQNILKQNNPLECEILGKKTVGQISRGQNFDVVEGGRHMSFIETISLLSGIATLTQCAILAYSHMRNKLQQSKTEAAQNAREELLKLVGFDDDELKDLRILITKDDELVNKIVRQIAENLDK